MSKFKVLCIETSTVVVYLFIGNTYDKPHHFIQVIYKERIIKKQ